MKRMIRRGLFLCVLMCMATQGHARLSDILGKVVSAVTGGNVSENSIVHDWTYKGAAVELSSDNALSQLGGTVASNKLEQQLNTYLSKVGVTAGKMTFSFKEDKTFTCTMNGKTRNGTYTLEDNVLNLKFTANGNGINCQTKMSGTDLELLMDADKILELANAVSSKVPTSSAKTLTTLLGNYSGMDVGLKFSR